MKKHKKREVHIVLHVTRGKKVYAFRATIAPLFVEDEDTLVLMSDEYLPKEMQYQVGKGLDHILRDMGLL